MRQAWSLDIMAMNFVVALDTTKRSSPIQTLQSVLPLPWGEGASFATVEQDSGNGYSTRLGGPLTESVEFPSAA